MNPLGTLVGWARDAWSAITGGLADVAGVLEKLWRYVTNVHNVVAWLTGVPELRYIVAALYQMSTVHLAIVAIREALHRLTGWLWVTLIRPWVRYLQGQITQLRALLLWWVGVLQRAMLTLYFDALAYTRQQVSQERVQRIRADQAEHAAMMARVAWALQTVQRQAVSGYDAGTRERLGVVGTLLHHLADRQPEVKSLTALLVKSVIDLETVDNPVLRFGISRLLTQIIGHLGVDRVTGDLIGRLLAPWTDEGRPHDLAGVERDTAARLTALEQQWAQFMISGGPEVEQAGREWRDLTGLATDAAVLGVVGLAVADPAAFARGAADTIGAAGNAALDAIVQAIRDV